MQAPRVGRQEGGTFLSPAGVWVDKLSHSPLPQTGQQGLSPEISGREVYRPPWSPRRHLSGSPCGASREEPGCPVPAFWGSGSQLVPERVPLPQRPPAHNHASAMP